MTPGNSNHAKGKRHEQAVIARLHRAGWPAWRAVSSGPDVLAISPFTGALYVVAVSSAAGCHSPTRMLDLAGLSRLLRGRFALVEVEVKNHKVQRMARLHTGDMATPRVLDLDTLFPAAGSTWTRRIWDMHRGHAAHARRRSA